MSFSKNDKIHCRVIDNNKVLYEGNEYSLSRLTIILMREMGYSGKHYNGYAYWLYNNTILTDYRDDEEE